MFKWAISEVENHILVNSPLPKSIMLSLHLKMIQMYNNGTVLLVFKSSYLFDIYTEILAYEI